MINDDALREDFERGWANAMSMPVPPAAPPGSFHEYMAEVAIARMWSRGQLSPRERRIVVLTALAMFGRDDLTKVHMGAALDLGQLSSEDLEEIAVTIATYGGFPCGVTFNSLRNSLVAERAATDAG